MPAGRQTRVRFAIELLVGFVILSVTIAASLFLTRQAGNVAALWPANAMVMARMLVSPPRQWPAWLAVLATASMLVPYLAGDGWLLQAAFTVANVTDALVCAALLQPYLGVRPDLTRRRHLLAFLFLGLIPGPALSATIAAVSGAAIAGIAPASLWPSWFVADGLGIAVVAPVALHLAARDRAALRARLQDAWTAGVLVAAAGITVACFVWPHPLSLAVPLPLLVLVAGQTGMAGAALAMLFLVGVGVGFTVVGAGPFAAPLATRHTSILDLQLYITCALAITFPAAAWAYAHRRIERVLRRRAARDRATALRLRRSEAVHRILTERSSDMITRVAIDGRRLYVSPSCVALVGWTPEEMLRPDWRKLIHPEDRQGMLEARDRLRDGQEEATATYRFARRAGGWAWLEARMALIRDERGEPVEFVASTRDITDRLETEARLAEAVHQLSNLAATDGLTGIANRRRLDEVLDQEWRRATRERSDLSLILIDADHFKAFNDRYGHAAGDDCLRSIARVLREAVLRPSDLAARYGGEEFCLLLPATNFGGAREFAERVRAAIESLGHPHADSPASVVTVSVGVATMIPPRSGLPTLLLEAADRALYAAKRAGRNRVEPTLGTNIELMPHRRGIAAAG